jgi:hypothetical protein
LQNRVISTPRGLQGNLERAAESYHDTVLELEKLVYDMKVEDCAIHSFTYLATKILEVDLLGIF